MRDLILKELAEKIFHDEVLLHKSVKTHATEDATKTFSSGWNLKYNFSSISLKYRYWKIMKDLLCIKQTWIAVFSRDEQKYNKLVRLWGILRKWTFVWGGKILQLTSTIWPWKSPLHFVHWVSVQFYSFSSKRIHVVKTWIPTVNKSIPKLKYATNMKRK